MRLTCPNCGARYEVDDSMIPPEGRDVQCSNCNTTWFQPKARPVRVGEADTAEAPPPQPPMSAAVPPPAPASASEPSPGPGDAASGQMAQAEPDDTQGASARMRAEPEAPPPAASQPIEDDRETGAEDFDDDPMLDAGQRPALDPAVRELLREEAEREAELRRQETEAARAAQAVQSADEAPSPVPEATHVEAAVADMVQASEADFAAQDAPSASTEPEPEAAGSRRDLLPDIEEINTTLRASDSVSAAAIEASQAAPKPRRRRGVRLGFALAFIVFAALILAYVNAPRIVAAVPQSAPMMEAYVTQVNGLRAWLDGLAQGALSEGSEAEPAPQADDPADTVATPAAETTTTGTTTADTTTADTTTTDTVADETAPTEAETEAEAPPAAENAGDATDDAAPADGEAVTE